MTISDFHAKYSNNSGSAVIRDCIVNSQMGHKSGINVTQLRELADDLQGMLADYGQTKVKCQEIIAYKKLHNCSILEAKHAIEDKYFDHYRNDSVHGRAANV